MGRTLCGRISIVNLFLLLLFCLENSASTEKKLVSLVIKLRETHVICSVTPSFTCLPFINSQDYLLFSQGSSGEELKVGHRPETVAVLFPGG